MPLTFRRPTFAGPFSNRLPNPAEDALSPEQAQATLLGQAGRSLASGLSIVGNALDLPGSMARDTLSGLATGDWARYNPLDQLLSPFSAENRSTGRDLLTNFGLTEPNDPNRWELGDFAGFGAEVLTDPFFWLPAGTLGKGVSAATKAIPAPVRSALKSSAAGRAVEQGGRLWNRLFDASVLGRSTKEGQQAARGLSKAKLASEQGVLQTTLPVAAELERRGLTGEAAAKFQRDVLEGVQKPVADTPVDLLKEARSIDQAGTDRLRSLGRDVGDLEDVIDYSARRMGHKIKDLYGDIGSGRDPRPLGAYNPGDVSRLEWAKGFLKGTNHVDQVLTDPEWGSLIASSAGKPKRAIQAIRDRIEEKYGQDILPTFPKRDEQGLLLFTKAEGGTRKLTSEQASKLVDLEDGTFAHTVKTNFGRGPEITQILTPQLVDRYTELAKKIVRNPELREGGLFTNHWLADLHESALAKHHQADAIESAYGLLSEPGVLTGTKAVFRKAGERATTLGDLLKDMRVNADAGAKIIAERLGLPKMSAKELVRFRKQVVRQDVADDLRGLWQGFKAPKEVGSVEKFANSFTSLFKAGVLTWPARYVRDIVSGQVRNWERGWFDHISGRQAHQLLQGRVVEGLEDIPVVKEWLARMGKPETPAEASNAVREMYASFKANPIFQNTDTALAPSGTGGLADLLNQVPGRQPTLSLQEMGDALSPTAEHWNPFNVRGVVDQTGNPREVTKFGPAAVGDMVGKYTDDMNRLVPFLNQIKKGIDPAEAMRNIQWAQVDYSPRTFTKTEQGLKKLFPFYSFTSRQLPYVAKELLNNPGGRLGQIIRAQNVGSGRGERPMPEYVAQSGGIDLGTLESGAQRYLAGSGLMHEDPLSFLGGGTQGALAELGSRLTPFAKAPIEWMTGESLFQRGPEGGRELLDMDPTLGRTISNVSELLGGQPWEDASGQAKPFLGRGFEFLVGNSPVSRLTTTVRTLTDPRKYEGRIPGLAAGVNALTGVRVSDISPAAQDAVLREALQAYARENLGARNYESTYVSKDVIARNEKENPRLAAQQKNFMALQRALQQRRKQRAKQQPATSPY